MHQSRAPAAGLRLARGVLASVAVGAGVGLRAVLPGRVRRGRVLRHALNTGPVLVGPCAVCCPCAAVVPRLSVLVAVVGHGRGRARCGRGAVEPGAGLADAGLSLSGELVAFLGGACRGGWLCARPTVAGLSALPSSMLLARLSVAVGFCRAVRPVLAVNGVLIVRVRGGAAGVVTWRAGSSRNLARRLAGEQHGARAAGENGPLVLAGELLFDQRANEPPGRFAVVAGLEIRPALRARKDAAMEGDERDPLGLAAGPAEGRERGPARSLSVGTVTGLGGSCAGLVVIRSPARDPRADT